MLELCWRCVGGVLGACRLRPGHHPLYEMTSTRWKRHTTSTASTVPAHSHHRSPTYEVLPLLARARVVSPRWGPREATPLMIGRGMSPGHGVCSLEVDRRSMLGMI